MVFFTIVKSSVLRGYIFDNIRVDLTRTDCWNWRMKFIGAKCFNPNGELKQLSFLVCLDVENVFFCFNESLVLTLSSHFINLSCMFLMFIVRYIINNWTKPMTPYTYIYASKFTTDPVYLYFSQLKYMYNTGLIPIYNNMAHWNKHDQFSY